MNRIPHNPNYDTKSSLFSLDYKIPYQSSLLQSSKIVQHLQQSQQQLQFLKLKLTEAYQKIQKQININIQLSDNNTQLMHKYQKMELMWQAQVQENKKLKEVMETVIKNRRLVEEEVQYTHRRYKKMMEEKEQECTARIQDMERCVRRLKKENQVLEESLQDRSRKESVSSSKVNCERQRKLQHKIQILQSQIKKLITQKVTEVTRLKHQIQCYQRSSVSPIHTPLADKKPQITNRSYAPKIQYFDIESNHCSQNENTDINIMQNNTIVQSKLTVQSKVTEAQSQQDSISKWQKNPNKIKNKNGELTDDQKLTRAQMEKKKIENQLMKIQRLKRHAPEDRQIIQELQKKIYEIDSQISSLKRKIRQKY